MRRVFISSLLLTTILSCPVYFYATLPDVSALAKNNPRTTSLMRLREQQNRDKGRRAARQHVWVGYRNISEHLKKAVVISEDGAFFSHGGVDPTELKEAFREVLQTMSFRRGGSTITMQLARNLYLSPAKTPVRKIKEILIAWQLEASLSKPRILEIYLNVVELGRDIYGVEAAARHYFGKAAAEVDVSEAATLAALLPNPRRAGEKNTVFRRNLVLARLAQIGYITQDQYRQSRRAPLFRGGEAQPSLLR